MAGFVNGAFVTRMWPDNSTELLATFQYFRNAKAFADLMLADDFAAGMQGSRIVAVDLLDCRIEFAEQPATHREKED